MSSQTVPLAEHRRAHRRAEAHGTLRLGVWIFLASECILFGALIGSYQALHARGGGPHPGDVLNVGAATVATLLLLLSSLTMAMAMANGRAGRMGATRLWLALTLLLGAGFLGIQGHEYLGLAREGLHLNGNVFAATFYGLTGTHGFHVLIGLLWLAGVLANALRGRLRADNARALEFVGLYWHFVDMAWMIIFPLVYLMPHAR
jgi:heme/copper-type cytochrome/quinol oxidase subunit 3